MSNIDRLRAEFPYANCGFAAKHGGLQARKYADAYNDARAKINPNNPRTITLARRRLAKLRELFPTEQTPAERTADR